jgi:ribokinase
VTKEPKIAVIGSLNMDLVVEVDSPPQVGETKFGKSVRFIPGGKGANQAVALAKLGAFATMVGAVGNDAFGNQMMKAMEQVGVDMSRVKQLDDAQTGVASILLTEGDNSIIVISGANALCSPEDVDRHEDAITQADLVLLQLEIPLGTIAHAIRTAKRLHKIVMLNPAPARELPPELLRNVDYITPNRLELAALCSMDVTDESLNEAMKALQEQGVRNVITTLGSEGCAYLTESGEFGRIPGYLVEVVDTTGAGDAFNAGLAYSLAAGQSLSEAVAFAGKVSALSVTKFGAQGGMPTLEEVMNFHEK